MSDPWLQQAEKKCKSGAETSVLELCAISIATSIAAMASSVAKIAKELKK